MTLRNPWGRAHEIKIDPARVFELPDDAAQDYTIVNPFKDQTMTVSKLHAGSEAVFKLQPFQVLVVEAWPDSH